MALTQEDLLAISNLLDNKINHFDSMESDIDLLKKVVAEHSVRLQGRESLIQVGK